MIELKTATIDGKQVAYSSETDFLVQIGRGKSAYKTKYSFKGNLGQAVMYYKGINIGNGYKKRLLMPACTHRPVIARQQS